MRQLARATGPVGLVAFLVLTAGCGQRAELVLHQSFAPPGQQHLELGSDDAYYADTGRRCVSVLTFPLPHCQDGPRTFVLYISSPASVGELVVDPEAADGACGFLIQECGHLAGRSDLASGTIRYERPWLSQGQRILHLNLRCQDGTLITGKALSVEDAGRVRALQREFAADIATVSEPALETASDTHALPDAEGGGPDEDDRTAPRPVQPLPG
jgi:hypothetical protein